VGHFASKGTLINHYGLKF